MPTVRRYVQLSRHAVATVRIFILDGQDYDYFISAKSRLQSVLTEIRSVILQNYWLDTTKSKNSGLSDGIVVRGSLQDHHRENQHQSEGATSQDWECRVYFVDKKYRTSGAVLMRDSELVIPQISEEDENNNEADTKPRLEDNYNNLRIQHKMIYTVLSRRNKGNVSELFVGDEQRNSLDNWIGSQTEQIES